MKTNKIILAGLMAVGCFFAACTEETPAYVPAEPETNEVQAYIYSNTPTSVQLTELGGKFPVLIGRNTTNATSLEVLHDDTLGLFIVEPEVTFAEGQTVDTLWIQATYTYGESHTLTLNIPEAYTTAYGPSTVTMSVLVDFTWVPMGKVNYISQWEADNGLVAIEQAKEYTDADGNLLFRLNSPYYYIAPKYCTVPGLHLQFLVDQNYNAVTLYHDPGFLEVENTGYVMYWDPVGPYAAYCLFANEGNHFYIICPWTDGSGLYGPYQEEFIWENYPGAAAE